MSESLPIYIGDYILTEKIGKGGFATVYRGYKKGEDESMEQIYAIKKYDEKQSKIGPEVEILANNRITKSEDKSENIGKYVEIIEDRQNMQKYLISKLYNGGDLRKYLTDRNNKPLKVEEIIHIMKNIINGLNVIHKDGIFHSDIKPENLMVHFENKEDFEKEVKNILKSKIVIIDFGCASLDIKKDKKQQSELIKGTDKYMHPILIERKQKKSVGEIELKAEKDIWSLGLVCLELLTGDLNKHYDIENNTYKIPLNENTSIELIRFIDNMLQYDSNNQIKLEALMKEPFLIDPFFHPFKEEYAGPKLKKIEGQSFLELNFRNNLNFNYDKLLKKEKDDDELNHLINKLYIELNENFLFTEPVLIPVIPKND